MMRTPAATWILVLGLLLVLPSAVVSQEEAVEPEAAPAAECEEGEECPEAEVEVQLTPIQKARLNASPGEYHETLEPLVGDWNLTFRIWTTADGEPLETYGKAESRWILDKRFVRMIYKGELLGRDFEGQRVLGYHNQEEEFVATWRDSLGTYTLIFKGSCDDVLCRQRTMTADLTDPISGQKLKNKSVFHMGRPQPLQPGEEVPVETVPVETSAAAAGTVDQAEAEDGEEPIEAQIVWSDDNDAYTLESFLVTKEGREFKSLEIVAERQ